MSDYILYSEKLSVGYDKKPVVTDIEIGVNRGEILTLIGPNGAGKTTILKSLIAQLRPVAGTVWMRGKMLQEIPPQELAKQMSVVLTERLNTEMMTCEDVVALGRYPYTGRMGILSEEDRRIVYDTMKLVSVEHLAEQDFRKLSDGQRQRVLLARALCQEPEVLILDEPTSFLDIRYKLEFLTILQRMVRERNLAVILSLHELDLAERISDRLICVKNDHIDRIGSPEEIFQPGYIRALYQLSSGSYNEVTGTPEMQRPEGVPEVFVIAGAGTAAATYRRLQRAGTPFATGILWENDLDYPVAAALAAEVISVPPFAPVTEIQIRRAQEMICRCKKVICTLDVETFSRELPWLKELTDCGKIWPNTSDVRGQNKECTKEVQNRNG
jgi:iron complex transport system ATP-binding protein